MKKRTNHSPEFKAKVALVSVQALRPACRRTRRERAGGHDHFVRKAWCLPPITMCARHLQPLRQRCQTCFSAIDTAAFAQYGDQLVLSCPDCQKPLDGMFGYDFVSDSRAVGQAQNKSQKKAWRRLAHYEAQALKRLKRLKDPDVRLQARVKDRMTTIFDLADILLKAEAGGATRPVDQVESYFFPSPKKLGYATRHLQHPFSACHLSERRKVWAVLIALAEDRAAEFGFAGTVYFYDTMREGMQVDTRRRFGRGLARKRYVRPVLVKIQSQNRRLVFKPTQQGDFAMPLSLIIGIM